MFFGYIWFRAQKWLLATKKTREGYSSPFPDVVLVLAGRHEFAGFAQFERFGIEHDAPAGIFAQIGKDLFVVYGFFVPGQKRFFHVIGQQPDELVSFGTLFDGIDLFDHVFQYLTVMTVTDGAKRIGNGVGTGSKIFFPNYFVRIIDIELEIGHDGQMIPQFMLEIVYVA